VRFGFFNKGRNQEKTDSDEDNEEVIYSDGNQSQYD
jgi:hypothetical protein